MEDAFGLNELFESPESIPMQTDSSLPSTLFFMVTLRGTYLKVH